MLLSGQGSEVYSGKFSPSGEHLVSGGFDRLIYLWNVYGETCSNYNMLKGSNGAILEVDWSRDGSKLYSVSADKSLAVWDAMTGDRIKKFKDNNAILHSLGKSINGHELIVTGKSNGATCCFECMQEGGGDG